MAGSSRVRTVLLASMAMGACGGSTAQGIADADAGGTAAITPQLCDGSDSVRFAGRSDGGGPIPPGLSMLAENGWQYLIVNGKCDAWILRDTYSPIHRAKLSADLAQVFARDLSLGGWDRISVPAGGCPDAGGLSFRFGVERLAGTSCGLDANHPFQKLATQFANQVAGSLESRRDRSRQRRALPPHHGRSGPVFHRPSRVVATRHSAWRGRHLRGRGQQLPCRPKPPRHRQRCVDPTGDPGHFCDEPERAVPAGTHRRERHTDPLPALRTRHDPFRRHRRPFAGIAILNLGCTSS